MSIVNVTAYPSKYAAPPYQDAEALEKFRAKRLDQLAQARKGKLYISFRVSGAPWKVTETQRAIAWVLGQTLELKPVYKRTAHGNAYDRGRYFVGGWRVSNGFSVCSKYFDLESMPGILRALQALADKGYVPDGELSICLVPERYDLEMVLNSCIILEARRELIGLALGFTDDLQFEVGQSDLALHLPLDSFEIPTIEACACLLYQVSAMATATKKARMKPCDMSNPKYQMRTWLLRLGFIGEQFERPRRTLLERLEGNMAFFDEESQHKAKDKRRQQKAMSLM